MGVHYSSEKRIITLITSHPVRMTKRHPSYPSILADLIITVQYTNNVIIDRGQ